MVVAAAFLSACSGDGEVASGGSSGSGGIVGPGRGPIQGASTLTVAQQNKLWADVRKDPNRLTKLSPAERLYLAQLLEATKNDRERNR